MMSVYNQIGIPMYNITSRIQKKASVFIIFLLKIVVQIIYIIRCLQYRIIDSEGNELDLKEEKDLDSSSTTKTKNKAKIRGKED